jgi:hypothetical protein
MLFNRRDCGCGCDYEPEMREPMMAQPMMRPPVMAPYADGMGGCGCGCQTPCDPIIEAPVERCVKRDICHEVQHICPVNTRIINNHIFRHTYAPHYTCCEENVVTNLDQGSCCNFR